MNREAPCFWAIVPAAGVGRRMGSTLPKQYLTLHGGLVIDHALATLVAHPTIIRVIVAISALDEWWAETTHARHLRVQRVTGGKERADSVLNGLLALEQEADPMDWVLVHDAARPCLHPNDLNNLIAQLASHPIGGLLAAPLSDTVKRADDTGRVLETLPREQLWRAFTPQMFRYGALRQALQQARADNRCVTDEASAIELAGNVPQLVEGRSDNIKITRPEDLALAEFYLSQRDRN
ncbi:2-C-methyl-D-erythritol 4-phosphate cytidylyltransferase [Sedimenticola sp.]|uniref:2-C-methyl-D-erythritol 4-phosphate cytidylyltransferase n=1 Tax=Sedimenticola sp. TaxID=1940285 RepID=UPI003D120760